TQIGLIGPTGRSVCHSRPGAGEVSASDRPYLREALARRGFVMGPPILDRLTGRRSIPFAMAVTQGDAVTGVLAVGLDLERASEALGRIALPEDARVVITDRRGVVLMEHPFRPERPVGRALVNTQLLQAARDMSAVTGVGIDVQGDERIFAAAVTRPVGDEAFMAIVSIERDAITGGPFRAMLRTLGMLAVTMALGLLAAWWFGRRSIVRPARKILGAVHRLQHGQLDSRVSLKDVMDAGEFSRIASAFNLMADSLQARQRDLESELERGKRAYELLEQVLNSFPDALIAVSQAGEVLMYNRAAALVVALDAQPPDEREWPQHYGLFHADGRTPYASGDLPLVRAAHGESGRGREMLIRNALVPEGRLFDCSYQPLREGGRISGGLTVFADVTERRRNQADLILLRRAVARLNDIVMITEAGPLAAPGPRIVFVNEAFGRLTGYSIREAVGQTPAMLYGPRTDEAALARMRKALLGGKAVREDLIHYARDGREMCLEVDTVPLASESGAYTHLISVLRDITARTDAERALRDSDQELEMFTRVLQRTAEAAKQITGQQSVRSTLQEVASQARLVIGSHAAQVSVTTESDWDQAVTALSLSGRNAVFATPRPLPAAADVYALTSGNGLPLRLTQAQLQTHPQLQGFAGLRDGNPPVRGLLALILTDRGGEEIGVLQVLDKEQGEFTERDEYVL
ncbi:MAG: PAS domain S-box protein, partial [Ramlibacter sp.]